MVQIEFNANIASSIKNQAQQLTCLLGSKQLLLVNVATNTTLAQVPGVYIILTSLDSQIVYAGKTNAQNYISRRMKDHRNGNSGSDLPIMIRKYPDLPQDVTEYDIKFIEIQDLRERCFFEQFVIGVLKPKLNG